MKTTPIRKLSPALLAAALIALGCDSNRSGDVRATRFGDLSHPLTDRTPALSEMRAVCDMTSPPMPAGTLPRRPYLQRVTDHSAQLVWTAASSAGAGRVRLLQGGAITAVVDGQRDPSVPPPRPPQWSAPLVDLHPDTLYCYELEVNGEVVRRGGVHTAPPAGSGHTVRFAALGDSGGGGADQRAVATQLATVPMDLLLHLGDIAYESGTRAQLDNYFFQVYADLLEAVPVFPASGNHEYETDDAAPFREAFVLPVNGAPDGLERWYSFDWGDVHFVVLDTERVGVTQAAWLDADLTANRLPWTVVLLHRPPFSSGDHGNDAGVQLFFVPLFERHAVPLVLAGHDHDYERTVAMNGVTYVVSGGGGRGTRPVGDSAFTAFSEAVCHFVYVTVSAEQLTLHAIDGVGQEFDSLVIARPAGR